MSTSRAQGWSWFSTLVAVSVAILVIDVLIPLGVASGVAYTLIVVLAWRLDSERSLLTIAGLGSSLTLIGLLLSPQGSPLWMVLINRLLSLLAIWTVAAVILRTMRNETALQLDQVILDHMFAGTGLSQLETGKLLYVNPRFEQMFGYEPGELIGKDAASLNAGENESAARLSAEIVDVARETGGWSGQLLNMKKDGSSFWCHASVTTFHHPTHGLVLVRVQEDISELRRAQDGLEALNRELEDRIATRTVELQAAQASLVQAEKMAALGRLAASVSHELRNPLGVVQNSLFVLGHELAGRLPELESIVERAMRNVQRCAAIITDMLDYARSSEPKLRAELFDDWLAELVEDFAAQQEHAVELELELGCAGVHVELDGERFRHVVLNLLENGHQAVRARPHLETEVPRLTVSTTMEGKRVALRIDDTGTGLPAGKESEVFEPFFSMKTFGVGLGLAIVKPIVESHGGTVSLTNHEQRPGARAEVLLPLAPNKGAKQGGHEQVERPSYQTPELSPS